jgi:hypothetical protein
LFSTTFLYLLLTRLRGGQGTFCVCPHEDSNKDTHDCIPCSHLRCSRWQGQFTKDGKSVPWLHGIFCANFYLSMNNFLPYQHMLSLACCWAAWSLSSQSLLVCPPVSQLPHGPRQFQSLPLAPLVIVLLGSGIAAPRISKEGQPETLHIIPCFLLANPAPGLLGSCFYFGWD